MPSTIILIPARLAATRLPNKPLADIGGLPLIVRAWRSAVAANLGPVVVAAGDPEIVEAIHDHGGTAVLTHPALPSGTDRIADALKQIDPERHYSTVINMQGDMPDVRPEHLRTLAAVLGADRESIATLVAPCDDPADWKSRDVVKAKLMWSSPSTGPLFPPIISDFHRGERHVWGHWRHVGIYGFSRSVLGWFADAPPDPLEQSEGLEQLRAVGMGIKFRAGILDQHPTSIDTPADLEAVRQRFAA